ncbi:translesion DNA synthesis-associated protein ImuA [SAR92 clade bacterium H455]|uniref:Translesion DNA synthesis-associated protein ImuA n=1 Tax=SAR92 clade bacterium H455 TaxID=2974818 RepID=A0ABY5TPM6_9GAMM|nr:translesion DNA synthesis-associated protein ImuA [SAR92 clade bacterium H455]
MPNTEIITKLLARHDTWRGQSQKPTQHNVSSGNDQIDLLLKGGWPTAALTELLVQRPGIGELSLLLPAIRDYCQNNHLSVWLDPPYQPYAPALAAAGIALQKVLIVQSKNPREWLWVAEQCIRNNALLLAWSDNKMPSYSDLRKLQLAAADSGHAAFLFSTNKEPWHKEANKQQSGSSPATLRLEVDSVGEKNLRLSVRKLRGVAPGEQLLIPRGKDLSSQTSLAKLPVNSIHPAIPISTDIPRIKTSEQRLNF